MKKIILPVLLLTTALNYFSQNVGINSTGANPDASAMLDVVSTDKGLLIPRMTTAQRTAISTPAKGLLVFDNDTSSFWYYDGTQWVEFNVADGNGIYDGDGTTPAGTDATVTDYVNFDANTLYIDGTNNQVGVGTNTPGAKLEVVGDVNTSAVPASWVQAAIIDNAAGSNQLPLEFRVAGTRRGSIRADAFGNLVMNPSGTGALYLGYDEGSGFVIIANGSGVETARFDNNGNLGLGTTAPTDKLDVEGDARINDNDIFLRTGTDQNHGIGWYGTGKLFEGYNVDGPVVYGWSGGALGTTNGGQNKALRWDNTGKVVINEAYSLPIADGSAGQVLTTDGAGAVSWGAGAGDGNGIYDGDGTVPAGTDAAVTDYLNFDANTLVVDGTNNRVGVGTNAPVSDLHVSSAGLTTTTFNSTTSGQGAALEVGTGGSGDRNSYMDLVGDDTYTDYGMRFIRWAGANSNSEIVTRGTGELKLNVVDAGAINLSTSNTNRMYITSGGNVGIATTTPSTLLAVGGAGTNVYATDAWIENNMHVQGNEALAQGGGRGRLRIGTAWGYTGIYSDNASDGSFVDLVVGASSGTVRVGDGASSQSLIVPNGNTGLGTSSPSANLDVVGTMQYVDGNEAAGKVMTSDASGNVSWQTPSGGGTELVDTDLDTKVQVEESADEDIIRFDLAGLEQWVMQGARLEPYNSGHSVFVGENAGMSDDLSDNRNIGIGYGSLGLNTSGAYNIGVGAGSLNNNTTGTNHVAIGHAAGFSGSTNTGSVSVGYEAGKSNTANYTTAVGYQAMTSNTSGQDNTALGSLALSSNSTGNANTAVGESALASNSTANYNTAVGRNSMTSNTTGTQNSATGSYSLDVNTTGSFNSAVGTNALGANTTASHATAVGSDALINSNADWNTGVGRRAAEATTSGSQNTAIGGQALRLNQTGINNTALGVNSLYNNTVSENTGLGHSALFSNTTGTNNTGVGYQAGYSNTTAINNTSVGYQAGMSSTTAGGNTSVGNQASMNLTGSYTTAVGDRALTNTTTGVKNTAVGGRVMESNTTGNGSVAVGYGAAFSNVTGNAITAIGYYAANNNTVSNTTAIGESALYSNTTGANNTALGYHAAFTNTTGQANTAVGYQAVNLNSTGSGITGVGYLAATSNTANYTTAVGDRALTANTSGAYNTAIGGRVMQNNTTGAANTAVGYGANYSNTAGNAVTAVGYQAANGNTANYTTAMGEQALTSNTTGQGNTAVGARALQNTTTSNSNTAMGYYAGNANVTGTNLTFIGANTGRSNTADDNTAVGATSLDVNTTGTDNTALGSNSMGSNTTGSANTALGESALASNTTANYNTAVGRVSLTSNTTGTQNTAVGAYASDVNTTGSYNTSLGTNALGSNTANNHSTAVGSDALIASTADWNTGVGRRAAVGTTTGYQNTAIGAQSMQTNTIGFNNTTLGVNAGLQFTESDYMTFIGHSSGSNLTTGNYGIASTFGYNAPFRGNFTVTLGNTSQTNVGAYSGWFNLSDGRFKTNVEENVPGIDFIKELRPVTYEIDIEKLNNHIYGDSLDPNYAALSIQARKGKIETGFIAQEVEEAAIKLGYDFNGVDKGDSEYGHYAISYSTFVVPLVKATQEQQVIIENQQKTIEQMQKEIEELKKLIKE